MFTYKKITSFIVSLIFTWMTIAQTAAGIGLAAQALKPLEVPPSPFSESLPSELGEVIQFHAEPGNQGPWAIHIQDAHANPDAQKNILQILQWIETHTRSSLDNSRSIPVTLEGAAGNLHPEYLDFFPDFQEINDAMITDLSEKGEIEGAELFAWKLYQQKRTSFRFMGIEEASVYRKDLKSYRELLYQRERIKTLLKPLQDNLELAKSRLLSPSLQKLLREKQHRKEGDYGARIQAPQLEPYIAFLKEEMAARLKIDLKDPLEQLRFPNLGRFLSMSRASSELQSEDAEKEAHLLFSKIEATAPGSAAREFLPELQHLEHSPRLRSLFERAWPVLERGGIPLTAYPHYLKRAGILMLQNELEGMGLWVELERCESALENSMLQSSAEKQLLELIRREEQLEKVLFLKVSGEDFSSNLFSEKLQDPGAIDLALHQLMDSMPTKDLMIRELERDYHKALDFYNTAVQRDQIMADRFMRKLSPAKNPKVQPAYGILIAGGFHTPGVAARFEQKKMNFMVIRPRIYETDGGLLYDQVMKDEHAALSAGANASGFSKQESLFLKALLETGFPRLAKLSAVSSADKTRRLVELINHHPVFKAHLEAQIQKNGERAPLQILRRSFLQKKSPLLASGTGAGLTAHAIRDAVLLVTPNQFQRLRGPLSAAGALTYGEGSPLGNVRWDSNGLGYFEASAVSAAKRSEVRVNAEPLPEPLKIGLLGLTREDIATAGVLAENGHPLTIASQDDGKLLSRITKTEPGDFPEKPVLFSALTNNRLQTLRRQDPGHLETLLSKNNVVMIASRLGEGLEYHKYKSDMLELALNLGAALARVRTAGDVSRKVIILRDHLGTGFSDLFYQTMRRQLRQDRNFDVVYSPNFGQRDENGKYTEKMVVFGLRDARTDTAIQNRAETKALLEQIYPSAVLKWSNIRSAELAYEAYLVLSAAKLTHFQSLAPLAEAIRGNVHEAAFGAGMDKRIGFDKINPSLAFGGQLALLLDWIRQGRLEQIFGESSSQTIMGPLLKKAVKLVTETSHGEMNIESILSELQAALSQDQGRAVPETHLYLPLLLEIIKTMNESSISASSDKILGVLSSNARGIPMRTPTELHDKVVAILGVGFKEKDSQITKSPVLALIDQLVAAGIRHFRISDPFAAEAFKRWVEDKRAHNTIYAGVDFEGMVTNEPPLSLYEAAEGADITVVAQESHPELKNLNLQELSRRLNGKPFFDGIGLFGRRANGTDPVYTFSDLKKLPGFNLVSLGRPSLEALVDSELYRTPEDLQKAGIQFVKKRITVMGGGYVGLVTAAKLAQLGHEVWVYDVVPAKIAMLSKANPDEIETPIYEPGLKERLREMARLGRFHATLDLKEAVNGSDAVYVAVPTPQADDGSADLSYIQSAAEKFAAAWKELQTGNPLRIDPVPFVIKSTVPPEAIHLSQRAFLRAGLLPGDVIAVSNPEFLKEGTAVKDVDEPDRTMFGIPSDLASERRQAVARVLLEIWTPLMQSHPSPFLLTTPEVTTMTKYAANSLLAISITLATILSQEAIDSDADFNQIIGILKSLDSIGPLAFINPGCWGGSCFPKDTRALNTESKRTAKRVLPLISFVDKMNDRFKGRPVEVIPETLKQELRGSTLAFFGMTFKPDTDDVRETPDATAVLKALQAGVVQIRIHDPIALEKPIAGIWSNFMYEIAKVAQTDRVFHQAFVDFLKQPDGISAHYLGVFFSALRQKPELLQRFRKLHAPQLTANQEAYFTEAFTPAQIVESFERLDEAALPILESLLQDIAKVDPEKPQHPVTHLLQDLFLSEIILKEPGPQGLRDRVIFSPTIESAVTPDALTGRPVSGILLMTDWSAYKKLTAADFSLLQEASNNNLRYVVDTRGAWNRLAGNSEFSQLGMDYASNRIPSIFAPYSASRSEVRKVDAGIPKFLNDDKLTTAAFSSEAAVFASSTATSPIPPNIILQTSTMTEGIFPRIAELSTQTQTPRQETVAALISQILQSRGANSEFISKVRQLARQTLGIYAPLFIDQTEESIHLVIPTDTREVTDTIFALLALTSSKDQVTFLVSRTAQDAQTYKAQLQDRMTARLGSAEQMNRLNVLGTGIDGSNLMKMLEKSVSSPKGDQIGIPFTQKTLLEQTRYMGPRRFRFDAVRLSRDIALFLSYAVLKKQLPDSTSIYELEETARRQGIDTGDMIARLQQFLAQYRQLAAAA